MEKTVVSHTLDLNKHVVFYWDKLFALSDQCLSITSQMTGLQTSVLKILLISNNLFWERLAGSMTCLFLKSIASSEMIVTMRSHEITEIGQSIMTSLSGRMVPRFTLFRTAGQSRWIRFQGVWIRRGFSSLNLGRISCTGSGTPQWDCPQVTWWNGHHRFSTPHGYARDQVTFGRYLQTNILTLLFGSPK